MKRLTHLITALTLITLSSATFAADEPATTDLVALLAAGVADDARVALGPQAMTFKRVAPGQFEGADGGDVLARMNFVETEPCHFDMTFTFGGTVRPIQMDATRIETITVTDGTEVDHPADVTSYEIVLTGSDTITTFTRPDGTIEPLTMTPDILTSVPRAEIETAAAKLQAACAGR